MENIYPAYVVYPAIFWSKMFFLQKERGEKKRHMEVTRVRARASSSRLVVLIRMRAPFFSLMAAACLMLFFCFFFFFWLVSFKKVYRQHSKFLFPSPQVNTRIGISDDRLRD